MRYTAHAELVRSAQNGRHDVHHLLSGIGVIFVLGYMLSAILISAVIEACRAAGYITFGEDLVNGATPEAMFLVLFSFAIWPFAIWVALRTVHHRAFGRVLGRAVVQQGKAVFLALAVLHIALFILPPWDTGLPDSSQVINNLPFSRWLLLLPLSLLAVLVQVSAEEVLFRGYLQQQLAARWASPLVWMVLPSLAFGLLHYNGDAGSNAWLFVGWAVMFALMMADLTARAGSLGPAIAVHFVNNAAAMLLIGVPDNLGGLALYLYPMGLEDEATIRALLPIDFMLMLVSWLTARLALRR